MATTAIRALRTCKRSMDIATMRKRGSMETISRQVCVTSIRILRSGVRRKSHAPFWSSGRRSDPSTDCNRMMLVFMDLASGYLLMEEVAVDRTYDTWYRCINGRLKTLGIGVLYLVSDRAKALVKLAHTGLDCLSIPDLFHLSHDLAKGYSLSIFGRLRQAQQALAHARQRLETLQASPPGSAQCSRHRPQ